MPQNKLAAAVSPYLLQHKDNPVHWRMWGEAALAEARRLNKPILLSIGYAACHWCHVMAHESFEDAGVAAVMNELTRSTWRRFTPSMVAETASPAWRPLSRTAHWAGPIAMGADRSLACRPTEFRSWPEFGHSRPSIIRPLSRTAALAGNGCNGRRSVLRVPGQCIPNIILEAGVIPICKSPGQAVQPSQPAHPLYSSFRGRRHRTVPVLRV